MGIYIMLTLFFGIGFVGIYLVNQKETDKVKQKINWIKYTIYLLLVFVQQYLINTKNYIYFAVLLYLIALYELIKIAKSKKNAVISVIVFTIIGLFFILFFKEVSIQRQQFVFIVVITFDGYSQIFGQLFGKTKLFPKTSPNKTLEGLFGGTLSVFITTILLSHIFDINKLLAICFGLFISVFSVLGDFLASYYKRYNKVKDYSNLIPAHGGVLDRFDSLIMASAGFYALLMLDFTNPNVFYFMVYVFAFLLLFLIGELAYHSLQSEVEISRKWVHIASGLLCLTFPIYINNHLLVMLLCVNFIFILLLSKHFYFLPSINKIDRKSYGSMLFPVSVYCCFLCFQYYNNQYFYFYLPILILAVCDPVAALVGKKWPLGKYKVGNDYKTLIGSMAFFVSCFLILLVSLSAFMPLNSLATIIMGSFLIAMSTTLVEAFSRNGFDNLTIPSSVILCLIMF